MEEKIELSLVEQYKKDLDDALSRLDKQKKHLARLDKFITHYDKMIEAKYKNFKFVTPQLAFQQDEDFIVNYVEINKINDELDREGHASSLEKAKLDIESSERGIEDLKKLIKNVEGDDEE